MNLGPFPTPGPSLLPDPWQQYTIAVREWQGDVAVLLVFLLVTIGALLVFFVAATAANTASKP